MLDIGSAAHTYRAQTAIQKGSNMSKPKKTADEIRKEIERIVNENQVVKSDGQYIGIARPLPLQGFDHYGCNWTIVAAGGPVYGHGNVVEAAIDDVKSRWDLAP